jgi:hypothetical protein
MVRGKKMKKILHLQKVLWESSSVWATLAAWYCCFMALSASDGDEVIAALCALLFCFSLTKYIKNVVRENLAPK